MAAQINNKVTWRQMIGFHVQLATNDNVYELCNYNSLCLICLEYCILTLFTRLKNDAVIYFINLLIEYHATFVWNTAYLFYTFTNLLCEYSLFTAMLHYLHLHRRWCDANSRKCLLTCTWSSIPLQYSYPQHTAVPESECICMGN